MSAGENEGFRLIESCEVDDGSVDGISPVECFVLGAEWEAFRQQLAIGMPFTSICHADNVRRLVAMAERHRRFVEDRPNLAPGWAVIWVGGELD